MDAVSPTPPTEGVPTEAPPSETIGLAPPRLDLDALPPRMLRELRASHVGETVAVNLYDGVAGATTDPELLRFAASHRLVELRHLRLFEAVLPHARRSRLMGFWRLSGRLMGGLPARLGPDYVYAVVAGVESWVDGHYAGQIDTVRRLAPDPGLLRMLEACRHDEIQHSLDAARLDPAPPWGARALARLAVGLSRLGVALARRV
ncbi:demethoxyubiquinone hydroxylase family protein [Azospirillum canadense]|uniref:demethoxyubiquinone hydroxylase family protein n=1 Tax=Azospirillum canadense TaxID=403962 RepID=UPI002226AB32|nr:demethoxyubiquinone hydroxylase family protein [Azospirillum canadense]MCW2235851.1 ubiquinone biosynthesis monooxygenase Coq7 [Azospirillum canadense]